MVHHVATSQVITAGWIRKLADGQALPLTLCRIRPGHPLPACCARDEILDLLAHNASSSAEIVRGLSDRQLDLTTTAVFAGGRPWRIEQLICGLLISHIARHRESIEATMWL